jgi:hypothetical protein
MALSGFQEVRQICIEQATTSLSDEIYKTDSSMGGVMLKFHFSIRTREGQKIDKVVISGRDQEHAEVKLRQMYRYCDILQCDAKHPEEKAASVEDILSLIAK